MIIGNGALLGHTSLSSSEL